MLSIRNLTKIYKPKKGPEVLALDNVTLDFQEKGLVFLLGKSGSGKSTLLNLLGGLDSYTSGELIIKGKSSKDFKPSDFDSYRNTFIGFIFQEFYILEEYSVAKNIGIALELQGKRAEKADIDRILAEVDLLEYGDRKPNELSGGQKQRVAIARALIKEPEIILADEPTGSLDSNTGRQIFETLKKLSRNKLVIVVSHDRENAEKYADRIIELKDGRVSDDVTKVSSDEERSGIIFSDKMIYIKPGYALTAEDTENINSMLKKASSDVILSFDDKLNKDVIKDKPEMAGLNKYAATNAGNTAIKEYKKEDFRLLKSRFPYKDSLKMGASALKFKRIRLAFTIILSFIAFTLFGLSDTMAAFNLVKTSVASIYDNNLTVVSVTKQMGYKYDGKNIFWSGSEVEFTDQDFNWIKENISEKYYRVKNADFYLSNHFRDSETEFDPYAISDIQGFIEINSAEDLKNLDLTLINGELPDIDEILISDFVADSFLTYNYCENKTYGGGGIIDESSVGEVEKPDNYFGDVEIIGGAEIDSFDDLIGKTLIYNEKTFTISGIVRTQADLEEYKDSDAVGRLFSGMNREILSIAFIKTGTVVPDGYMPSQVNTVYVKLDMTRAEAERLFLKAENDIKEAEAESDMPVYLRFSINTRYTDILNMFSEITRVLKKVFLYISLVMCGFSFLLFMNFIGTSIANKRKEIGILRAIGARGSDVYGIFFNESMIIALINLALAISGTLLGAWAFNSAFDISVMVVSIRQIAFLTLLAVGVAALGSFLPVYRFAKKKPIETINNR